MPTPSPRPPGQVLRDLLRLGHSQDLRTAQRAALDRAVGELVPDEALMLARLAELGRVPVVHIHTRPHTGAAEEPVLENATRLGRLADVAIPDLAPVYVTHLLTLGLVEVGELTDDLADYVQPVLAEPTVLRALARANADGKTPRVLRHTLSLTALGAQLCAEALDDDGPPSG